MDWLELPLMAEGFLDVRVAAAVCVLATQWLKRYLPDWRFTNLLALGGTVAVELLAVVASGGAVAGGVWFEAVWAGVLGASLATFGYEALANLAGRAGVGPRAEG
jgi:hypothetical protein